MNQPNDCDYNGYIYYRSYVLSKVKTYSISAHLIYRSCKSYFNTLPERLLVRSTKKFICFFS